LPSIARAGDIFIGTCSQCDGASVVGYLLGDSATVFGDGQKVALDGGIGMGVCGHMTIIMGGSSTVMADGKKVAMIGTQVANSISGTIVSGSPTINIGG